VSEPLTLEHPLARPEAAEELVQTVRAAGHQIEVLVNNAGIFFGEVADADPAVGGGRAAAGG
jgi:short-subunit dehydrogenase